MVKKERHFFSIILIFLLVFFICGIFIGRYSVTIEFDEYDKLIKKIELDSQSYNVEQNLIKSLIKEDCSKMNTRVDLLFNELFKLGSFLDQKQKANEFNDNFYLLKKRYNLMQIKAYLTIYNIKQECNYDKPIIVFFYADNSVSKKQGFVLDEIVNNYGAKVFAIEYDYADELIFFETFYDIKDTPSLVINYNNVLNGFSDYEIIESNLK